MEGVWYRNRRSNPEGDEGDSQDDDRGKLLHGSWAAGPDRRTKDPGKHLSKKEKKRNRLIS